jgi:Putative zinc-finger
MKCEQLRERLALLIYGDLNPDEMKPARDHLDQCAACRRERDSLISTRQALDSAPVPDMRINVAAIQNQALALQARSMRRWKRFAFAAMALAASLLALLVIRPDIRINDGELAIRWAAPAEPPRTGEPIFLAQAPPVRDAELDERIRVLSNLIQMLNLQMEGADQKRRDELEVLIARVDLLRIQSQQRWDETNRDVTALYTAQFGRRE